MKDNTMIKFCECSPDEPVLTKVVFAVAHDSIKLCRKRGRQATEQQLVLKLDGDFAVLLLPISPRLLHSPFL